MPKILIFSDAVGTNTGLGRITRMVAAGIHGMPDWKVATVGQGALKPDNSLPWDQYPWDYNPQFIIRELPQIWEDFTRGDDGIFLSIQDANRMLWLADAEYCQDKAVKDFLYSVRPLKRMKLWGYFPVDGHNINGGLGPQCAHVFSGYDRVLAYTKFGAGVISKTMAMADPAKANEIEYIPHGIDTSVFYPRDRKDARENFGKRINHVVQWMQGNETDNPASVPEDGLAIGIVATNQPRKDFGLGIQAIAEVAKTHKVFVWIHTDRIHGEWSILELLSDFKLIDSAVVSTGNIDDATMAWCYSAMDVTLGIGRGEGFGFPIFESLACGTPCVHGKYAGAADFINPRAMPDPLDLHIQGPWNILRPFFYSSQWSVKIREIAHRLERSGEGRYSVLPVELNWNNVWPRWAEWLKNES